MKQVLSVFLVLTTTIFYAQQAIESKELNTEIQTIENSLVPRIVLAGEEIPAMKLDDRMKTLNVPGVSVAVFKDGKIRWARGYGVANSESGTMVDTNTLFQAGSISKPVAALAILKLVDEGKADLDVDVNTYLTDWKVPETEFTETEKVTLRRLLTHTAGTTVHGFPGYKQTDNFPSDVEVLNGKGNTDVITVDTEPGTNWRYSGGGYTIMEKVVEDISGMTLADYSARYILPAMGMSNSTFEQPLSAKWHDQASAAYDHEGNLIEGLWNNYPEQAAAGLWTTPIDLAKYCMEVQQIMSGKEDGVLSRQTIEKMLTKHERDWGLGPSLRKEGDSLMFGHGGKNAGFSNNMAAFAYQGHGVIVMTNADNGTSLMGEVIRAVSDYYGWDMAKPEIIKTIDLSEEALRSFTGNFKMNEQVPGVGDYLVEINTKDRKLIVTDKITGEVLTFYPVSDHEFREINDGDYLAFKKDDQGTMVEFTYNNRYVFDRTD